MNRHSCKGKWTLEAVRQPTEELDSKSLSRGVAEVVAQVASTKRGDEVVFDDPIDRVAMENEAGIGIDRPSQSHLDSVVVTVKTAAGAEDLEVRSFIESSAAKGV